MRTLAIDLGARRVGLALSDEGGRFATPWDILQVNGVDQAIEPILRIVQEQDVRRIVIGLPLNMDGTIGPAAKQTAEWARQLAEKSGKPIVFVDERLSSFAAGQHLADRRRAGERLTHQKKKARLDAIAAAGFLQEFLDGRLPAINVSDPPSD